MASFPILFITGANTGLGLETVKSLCQSSKGYTIILGGRYLAKAEAAIKEVQNTFPSSASTLEPVQINVEDDNSIETVFNYVTEKYGHLDVLINNAGKTSNSNRQ
jgi:NADP-dependent 3-hydroxy acid dehydrogenase YdfG